MDWFGLEVNHQNQVVHATFAFDGTSTEGQSLHLHVALQTTVNANGTTTVDHLTGSCS